jgi:hypothetical protein
MARRAVFAVLLALPALLAAETKESCPLGPFELKSPRVQATVTYQRMSAVTEAVSGGRRRSVAPPHGSKTVYPASVNFVDSEIFGKMQANTIAPAPMSTDEEFLRRITIDLTGQIPDVATLNAFLADTSADKRTKKIDELLASDAFVDRWTMWFGDLVQNVQISASSREFPQGRNAYYTFIHDSIRDRKPYDQMVREILSGKGDSFVQGPPNYWVRQIQGNGPIQDTYDNLAAHAGEKFLGLPLLCLSCHNGPGHLQLVNRYLGTRTRADFWGMAAFFAKTRAIRSNDPNTNNQKYDVEDNLPNGTYALNTNSGNKTPRQPVNGLNSYPAAYMFTGETPRAGEPLRDAFGRMLTADRQFSRATVNYLWKEMFGLGIVEPTNNIDLSSLDSQPTHPALLTLLTTEFINDKYDLRAILRTIAVSNAYQLSTIYDGTWNESWTPYFARHIARRLPAESLVDAIAKATNVPVTYNITGGLTSNLAMKLPDPTEVRTTAYGRFMDEFGRGNRDDEARSNDTSIPQVLSMMNDATVVTGRIKRSNANTTVARTLASTSDKGAIVEQLYLNTLSRHPTAVEKEQAIAYLGGGTLANRTEDLQWVLLNSLDFLFY